MWTRSLLALALIAGFEVKCWPPYVGARLDRIDNGIGVVREDFLGRNLDSSVIFRSVGAMNDMLRVWLDSQAMVKEAGPAGRSRWQRLQIEMDQLSPLDFAVTEATTGYKMVQPDGAIYLRGRSWLVSHYYAFTLVRVEVSGRFLQVWFEELNAEALIHQNGIDDILLVDYCLEEPQSSGRRLLDEDLCLFGASNVDPLGLGDFLDRNVEDLSENAIYLRRERARDLAGILAEADADSGQQSSELAGPTGLENAVACTNEWDEIFALERWLDLDPAGFLSEDTV